VADVKTARLAGRKIPEVEKEFEVSVILHKSSRMTDYNPQHDFPLEPGDALILMAPMENVRRVEEANRI